MKQPFPNVVLRSDTVTHVISRTRPSLFLVCNTEKLGIGPGDEAMCAQYLYVVLVILTVIFCTF